MSDDVVDTWDGVQNTSCWVHDDSTWETDGVVERSAVDIVALAGQAQQSAENASASAVSAGDSAQSAGGYAGAASGYAGSAALSENAASGYAYNASAYAESIISGGYVTSATVSDVVDAAIAAGGYVTSAEVSTVVDDAISSGGYVTSADASNITSSYVVSGGYVTSSGASAITSAFISSGGYATSAWVTSQGYATTAYVAGATVASAGIATTAGAATSAASAGMAEKIGTATVGSTSTPVYISAGVPVSMSVVASATAATSAGTCTGNAATATDASSLGGVAAASYALDANVVKLSGDQTIGGTKTFSSDIVTSAIIGLRRVDNSGEMWVTGGRSTNAAHGARIGLFGADHATSTSRGQFIVHAGGSSAYKQLIGKPNGTFTWNGQNIQVGSDERIKTAIEQFPDAVLEAWGAVQWEQFKYREDAERKGEENCRYHAGLVTQHVQQAMQAQGVDLLKYGILCHEEWQDETDEESNVIREAGDLWMVRYTEALAMEAAYQRRRADNAESRIAELERKMEAVIAALEGAK